MNKKILIGSILAIALLVLVSISPSIYADRDKVSLDPVPDLECEGEVTMFDVKPGDILNITFIVENIGEPNSFLNWEVLSWPEWGEWSFAPLSGTNLTPENGNFDIMVQIISPDDPLTEFGGEIIIINTDNENDFCIIDVELTTNKPDLYSNVCYDGYTPIQLVFLLINKLRYYEGIESEEDLIQIIESDGELSGIVDELKSYSCGCNDNIEFEWPFPIICIILLFPCRLALKIYVTTYIEWPLELMVYIGRIFHCWWSD